MRSSASRTGSSKGSLSSRWGKAGACPAASSNWFRSRNGMSSSSARLSSVSRPGLERPVSTKLRWRVEIPASRESSSCVIRRRSRQLRSSGPTSTSPAIALMTATIATQGNAVDYPEVMRCLVGAGAAQDRRDRLGEDPQIAREREVLDVVELDGQALLEIEGAAAEHLHRPRHPRLDGEPETVLGPVALDEPHPLRARPDDAHFAPQHVDELRKLVDREAPQQLAHPRHTRIATELEHRVLELVESDEVGQLLL